MAWPGPVFALATSGPILSLDNCDNSSLKSASFSSFSTDHSRNIYSSSLEPEFGQDSSFSKNCDVVLSEFTKKKGGFVRQSLPDVRRFIKCYNELFSADYSADDRVAQEQFLKTIESIGFFFSCSDNPYNERVFSYSNVLGGLSKTALVGYIQKIFANNSQEIVYYEKLAEIFNEKLSNLVKSHPKELLKAYIEHLFSGQNFDFTREDYFCCYQTSRNNVDEIINQYLLEQNATMFVSKKMIKDLLPYVLEHVIDKACKVSRSLIYNEKEQWFNCAFIDQAEAGQIVSQTLSYFELYKPTTIPRWGDLENFLKNKCPEWFETYAVCTPACSREILKYVLKESGLFKTRRFGLYRAGCVKTKDDIRLSIVVNLLSNFGDVFTLQELKEAHSENEVNVEFAPIYTICRRVSNEQFVSLDVAQALFPDIVITKCDRAIKDLLGNREFSSLQDIDESHYYTFPSLEGYAWNIFVFEQYLGFYSHEYRLIHKGYCKNDCFGGLVSKSSSISDFNGLLVEALAGEAMILERLFDCQKAQDFLNNSGYMGGQGLKKNLMADLLREATVLRKYRFNV